jgi:hypothetical protein
MIYLLCPLVYKSCCKAFATQGFLCCHPVAQPSPRIVVDPRMFRAVRISVVLRLVTLAAAGVYEFRAAGI